MTTVNLADTGLLPSVQAVLELTGLDCGEALRASDTVAKLNDAGAMQHKAQQFFSRCESPIERQFVVGAFLNDLGLCYQPEESCFASLHLVRSAPALHVALFPQIIFHDSAWVCSECGPRCGAHYPPILGRADFTLVLIRQVHRFRVAIEIDGRDFHTKADQVQRDHARDRRILADICGPDCILRFSGSEVFADPIACFNQAVDALLALELRDHYRHKIPEAG